MSPQTCARITFEWDQNLITEWHQRYGGRGVMVYWHVEKKSVCVHSQLKTVSSSKVTAMLEGVLRHCTDVEIERQYVNTHEQSEVGFAFAHCLGFHFNATTQRHSPSTLVLTWIGFDGFTRASAPCLTSQY
jgi:TnpA family transposase